MDLTKSSVWMLHNKSDPESYHPIVQILEYYKLRENNYQFVISDSIFKNQALGNFNLLKIFETENDVACSIVKVTGYNLVSASGVPILYIKELEFVRKCDSIIGTPKAYKHEEYREHQVKEMIQQPVFPTLTEKADDNITTRKIPQSPTPISYQPKDLKTPSPVSKLSISQTSTFSLKSTDLLDLQSVSKLPSILTISEEEPELLYPHSLLKLRTPTSIPSQSSNLQYSLSKSRDFYTPIAHLIPNRKEWTIKARIFSKYEMTHWTNTKSSGKMFRCSLVDSYGSEIEAVFFNGGVDAFFDKLHEGKVYIFTNGKVKVRNPKYNKIENDFQLTFDQKGIIVEQIDDNKIPCISFQFTNFDRVLNFPSGSLVDILAVVIRIGDSNSFRSKSDKDVTKRSLSLIEYNEKSIEIAFWNDQANDPIFETLDKDQDHILAIKNVKLNEYKDIKNFSIDRSSKYYFNPTDIKDADKLRKWWDSKKYSINYKFGSNKLNASFCTIKEINKKWEDVDFESEEKASYLLYGFIAAIKDEESVIWYDACSSTGCRKKVIVDGNGFYYCNRCQKAFEKCVHRYLVNLKICDNTESTWASAFDESGEILFGRTAESMYELYQDSQELVKETITNALHNYYEIKITVRKDQGKTRVNIDKLKSNPDSSTLTKVYLNSMLDCLS